MLRKDRNPDNVRLSDIEMFFNERRRRCSIALLKKNILFYLIKKEHCLAQMYWRKLVGSKNVFVVSWERDFVKGSKDES